MTPRLQRLFQLLALLRTGWYNIEALQLELRVTDRQIFRDLDTLRSLGFVIPLNSKTRKYELRTPVVLPAMHFELDEVIALIALCNVEGNHERMPAAGRAAMKLLNILPSELQESAVPFEAALTIMPEPTHALSGFRTVYDTVLESYQKKRAIRIRFKSPIEPEFVTVLEPYLFFCRHSWYVIGQSSLHRERRTFHLGRITHMEPTRQSYEIPVGFTLKQYLGNAWRMIREPGPDQKVTVRFSKLVAQNVAEVFWHSTQHIAWNEDGTMDFTVTVSGLNEISWWILGYGSEAKVIRPLKLKKIIQEHAKKMLEQYGE